MGFNKLIGVKIKIEGRISFNIYHNIISYNEKKPGFGRTVVRAKTGLKLKS